MTPTTFADFYALGFKRLVPVIPPAAPISETSSLFKRVGTPQDGRGKTPGVRGKDGSWHSFDWTKHEADELDCQRWQNMAAGIGVKMGQGLYFIDADTMDKALAGTIQMGVTKHFGVLCCRIGNWPKAGYLIRVSEAIKYMRVEFGDERLEILGEGRFAVFAGTHPKTLKPYTWPFPLLPFDQIPIVTAQQMVNFLEDMRLQLPKACPKIITEGSANDVSQASLKGTVENVRKAVAATPNTSAAFGTREAYRDYGYAIRAALPDNEPEAFEIFSEWCGRWTDGENNPDVVAADWRRMKPPYRRGASWLYETAEQHAPEAFKKVDVYFDEIPEPSEPLFGHEPAATEPPVGIQWVNPFTWEGVTPPVRRWVVGDMVPDGEVTLLTGAGGVGKTLLAQQLATSVATGLPFLGRPTMQRKVMLFLCEDSEDELQLRQRAICLHTGVSLEELSPVLRIASRKFMDNLLAIWTSSTGAMKRTAVWNALRDDAIAFGAQLIVVDTIADTFGGNEIDRSQVRQFVQACLGKLAQETNGAVLALGHPSKAGQAVGGDGTSGSTAWHASVRSRLYLQHAAKDKTGPVRRLENMKANYGAGGDVFMLRWLRGAFDLMSSKVMGPEDGEAGEGSEGSESAIAGAGTPSMGNVIDDAILVAVRELADEGVPLSKAVNSPHWAPRVFKRTSDVLGLYMMDDIEAGWLRVLAAGRVKVAVVGRKPHNRMPIVGFVVVSPSSPKSPETIFD